jgi:transcriptional regulator of acetoin/glycerol metabolism
MTQVSTTRTPFFPAAPARRLLARVVADCDGNLTAASLALQVDRSTLHRLLTGTGCARTPRTGSR